MLTAKDLSAKEKLKLICGVDRWHTSSCDGKLPVIKVSDGPVGLRTEVDGEDGKAVTLPAVAYPALQLLSQTWDEKLAYKMGAALADDCIERDIDVLLAPGVNIKRTPVNGRNFEYFSEDPIVAGTMSEQYIRGVQDGGVGACLKHFCLNNLEYDRRHQSSDVDERTMREIYLKPFELACRAKPWTLMCSYNRVNGVQASENKKGFDLLRNEFGFDGLIMSDWDAVLNRARSARAGLDLEMPYNEAHLKQLFQDYENGLLPDAELDIVAQRVIDLVYKNEEAKKTRKVKSTVEQRKKLSAEILENGAVLLKNNGLLPLKRKTSVSVCGRYGKHDDPQLIRGGGSAGVERFDKNFNLPAALGKRLDGEIAYETAFGPRDVDSFWQDAGTAVVNAAKADVNIVCVGTGEYFEYEGGDREFIRLSGVQQRAIIDTARQNPNTVVVIFGGAAVDMSAWIDAVAAVLYVGFPGESGDEVIADILTGKINPSGKLTETFAGDYWDYPSSEVCPVSGVTRYHEGLDVGYRYFDSYGEPVAFPFGFGLSYSEFKYDNLKLKPNGAKLDVKFDIQNVSNVDGKEVAQVYVRECVPKVYRPYKELKAFKKVAVKAGETKEVKLTLDRSAFEYWSTGRDCKTVDDGVFEIIVGASVADIRLRAKVVIENGIVKLLS